MSILMHHVGKLPTVRLMNYLPVCHNPDCSRNICSCLSAWTLTVIKMSLQAHRRNKKSSNCSCMQCRKVPPASISLNVLVISLMRRLSFTTIRSALLLKSRLREAGDGWAQSPASGGRRADSDARIHVRSRALIIRVPLRSGMNILYGPPQMDEDPQPNSIRALDYGLW